MVSLLLVGGNVSQCSTPWATDDTAKQSPFSQPASQVGVSSAPAGYHRLPSPPALTLMKHGGASYAAATISSRCCSGGGLLMLQPRQQRHPLSFSPRVWDVYQWRRSYDEAMCTAEAHDRPMSASSRRNALQTDVSCSAPPRRISSQRPRRPPLPSPSSPLCPPLGRPAASSESSDSSDLCGSNESSQSSASSYSEHKAQLREQQQQQQQLSRVHFVGIGGAGLSALATLALKQGIQVSGSDATESAVLAALRRAGATVYVGHDAGHIRSGEGGLLPNALVVSSAVPEDNVEVVAAEALGIPVYKRGEWLRQLTQAYDVIAVAGAHGKTTTTAMLALALSDIHGVSSLSALLGATATQFPDGGSTMVGSGSMLVLEADEYDRCLLNIAPQMALLTNVEWEHVDIYENEADVRATFTQFAKQIKPGGTLIYCGDDAGARAVALALLRHDEAATSESSSASTLNTGSSSDADAPTFFPPSKASSAAFPTILDTSAISSSSSANTSSTDRQVAVIRDAGRASWLDQRGHPSAADTDEGRQAAERRRVVSYGLAEGNEWQAMMLAPNTRGGTDYVVVHRRRPMARVSLLLPGTHNVLNSLAVVAAAALLAAEDEDPYAGGAEAAAALQLQRQQQAAEAAARSLSQFVGTQRRFETVGRFENVVLIDDYAHHPTEVRASLQAARQRYDEVPIWVVFQPHTYSRLARLMDDFAPAFSAANRVIVTQVYAAREENKWGVSGQDLADAITGAPAIYIPCLDDIAERLSWEIRAFLVEQRNSHDSTQIRWPPPPGDLIVMTMGAGDVTRVNRDILLRLEDKVTKTS